MATMTETKESRETEVVLGKRNSAFTRTTANIALTGFVLVTLFPFFYMIRTALSTTRKLSSDPLSVLPVDFTWVRSHACWESPLLNNQSPKVALASRSTSCSTS